VKPKAGPVFFQNFMHLKLTAERISACVSCSVILSDDHWAAAGYYALQIRDWLADNQFCGRCGQGFKQKEDERALICTGCAHVMYPRINPCIIVSVCNGDRILLARSMRFPNKRLYSVLAGFVEPGETLEECVCREVTEQFICRTGFYKIFHQSSQLGLAQFFLPV